MKLKANHRMVAKDDVLGPEVAAGPKDLRLSDQADMQDCLAVLREKGERRVDAGMEDTHAMLREVDPERQGIKKGPFFGAQLAGEIQMIGAERNLLFCAARTVPTEEAFLVVSANRPRADGPQQTENPPRIGATSDQIACKNQTIARRKAHSNEQRVEFLATPMNVADENRPPVHRFPASRSPIIQTP